MRSEGIEAFDINELPLDEFLNYRIFGILLGITKPKREGLPYYLHVTDFTSKYKTHKGGNTNKFSRLGPSRYTFSNEIPGISSDFIEEFVYHIAVFEEELELIYKEIDEWREWQYIKMKGTNAGYSDDFFYSFNKSTRTSKSISEIWSIDEDLNTINFYQSSLMFTMTTKAKNKYQNELDFKVDMVESEDEAFRLITTSTRETASIMRPKTKQIMSLPHNAKKADLLTYNFAKFITMIAINGRGNKYDTSPSKDPIYELINRETFFNLQIVEKGINDAKQNLYSKNKDLLPQEIDILRDLKENERNKEIEGINHGRVRKRDDYGKKHEDEYVGYGDYPIHTSTQKQKELSSSPIGGTKRLKSADNNDNNSKTPPDLEYHTNGVTMFYFLQRLKSMELPLYRHTEKEMLSLLEKPFLIEGKLVNIHFPKTVTEPILNNEETSITIRERSGPKMTVRCSSNIVKRLQRVDDYFHMVVRYRKVPISSNLHIYDIYIVCIV